MVVGEAKRLSLELMESAEAAFLAYFATSASSSKVDHIKRHPKVSVYYCIPAESRGLMLSGEMEIVTDGAVKEALWQEGWDRYYPEGVHDPDYTVLRLLPARATYLHQVHTARFSFEHETTGQTRSHVVPWEGDGVIQKSNR